MIPVQFRPKYALEQYVVTFRFPTGLSGDVTVSSEVETGEPGLLVGPFFRFQETVSVVVSGGYPGSVYKIFCSLGDFEFVGRIAVKNSPAVLPSNTPVAPFTKLVTTPPYPVPVEDSIDSYSKALLGIRWTLPIGEVGLSSHALDGVHRELIAKYEYGPEDIEVSSHALAGTHRPLIAKYENYEPEEIQIFSYALNGVHKLVLLAYTNYVPEEIEVTSYALSGTHGPA